MFVTLGGFAF